MDKECRFFSIVIIYIFLVSALLLYLFIMRPSAESIFASIACLTWSVVVTVFFFNIELEELPEEPSEEEKEALAKTPQNLRLQYEQLNAEIRGRDNLTIVAGSIMITVSLLLLGALIQLKSKHEIDIGMSVLVVFTIIAIYSIWFLGFNLTSRKLNRLEWHLLGAIETTLGFQLHKYVKPQVGDTIWWRYGRRPVWLYFFYILTVASVLVLLA